uniref:Uncharacterized protein n=1 Tax=Arundo donax TaxID=35708 RepID=A0A0A9CHJ3_ARUDO
MNISIFSKPTTTPQSTSMQSPVTNLSILVLSNKSCTEVNLSS